MMTEMAVVVVMVVLAGGDDQGILKKAAVKTYIQIKVCGGAF